MNSDCMAGSHRPGCPKPHPNLGIHSNPGSLCQGLTAAFPSKNGFVRSIYKLKFIKSKNILVIHILQYEKPSVLEMFNKSQQVPATRKAPFSSWNLVFPEKKNNLHINRQNRGLACLAKEDCFQYTKIFSQSVFIFHTLITCSGMDI